MSDSPSPIRRKLTPKQELFIIEYAKDFNATQAAIRAGYSPETARAQACRLLTKVGPLIEARKHARLRESGGVPDTKPAPVSAIATLEQSLALATALAFHDQRKLYNEFGARKDMSKLTKRQQLCVVDVAAETDCYRTIDRAPYLNMLLKYHGAFPSKKTETTVESRDAMAWKAMPIEERLVLREKIGAVIREHLNVPKVINGRG